MNHPLTFLSQHWIIGIVIAIIVIFAIFALIRTAIKIAIILFIIGIILVVIFGFNPSSLLSKGQSTINNASTFYHKNIEPNLTTNIDHAKMQMNPSGNYTINTPDVKITGQNGDKKVTITYNDKTYTMNISQFNDHIKQTINDYLNQHSN